MDEPKSGKKRTSRRICCVPQCKNYAFGDDGLAFHTFPCDKTLRKQWEVALKIGKPASNYMRVCSDHFKETDYFPGYTTKSRKVLKKNTVPTQNLPIRTTDKQKTSDQQKLIEERSQRAEKRSSASAIFPEQIQPHPEEQQKSGHCSDPSEKQSTTTTTMDATTQTNVCPIHQIIHDKSTLFTFTGLHSFELLNGIVKCLEDIDKVSLTNKKYLDMTECVLLTLVKIKINLSYRGMGPLFGISRQAVSKYFKQTVGRLAIVMESVIPWPDQEDIRSNLPIHFKNYRDTRVVVDCAETPIERSTCLKCRILTYSHYKKTHTVKFMLGVAPSGLITTISKCYGGRASDKLITMQSHILDKLEYQDAIMADKGFFIQKECLERSLTLHQPPFLSKKTQLTREEALKNAEIARARVHVERVIQRVRQFEMIACKVEWTLLPFFEDVLIIACGITNLSSPVINIDKFI